MAAAITASVVGAALPIDASNAQCEVCYHDGREYSDGARSPDGTQICHCSEITGCKWL